MINSNYYSHLYFLIAVFATYVNVFVAAEYDNYRDLVPPKSVKVQFINVDDPDHPSNLCKFRLNISDGEWDEYHEKIIPSNICAKHITCIGTGYKEMEYTMEMPKEGVRCQRVTQNQFYNFGYGCYDGMCVPITCLDDGCWERLERRRKLREWLSPGPNTYLPLIAEKVQPRDELTTLQRFQEQYPIPFLYFPYRYRKPSTSAPLVTIPDPNYPTDAPQTASPSGHSQVAKSHIIYFDQSKQ